MAASGLQETRPGYALSYATMSLPKVLSKTLNPTSMCTLQPDCIHNVPIPKVTKALPHRWDYRETLAILCLLKFLAPRSFSSSAFFLNSPPAPPDLQRLLLGTTVPLVPWLPCPLPMPRRCPWSPQAPQAHASALLETTSSGKVRSKGWGG